MGACCSCSGADDDEEERSVEGSSRSPVSRPLLRMRWGPSSTNSNGGTNGTASSGDESKATLLDGGVCFRFAGGRYTLSSEVGRGAHCVVWRCLRVSSHGEPRCFALKLHTEENSAFKREIAALHALEKSSPRGTDLDTPELFPRALGTVRVLGRTALAMPLYGPDLYQLQKKRDRRPFPSPFVWSAIQQLLEALEALQRVGLVHADIKPQNVVLHSADVDPAALGIDTRLTLIDLGSCLTEEQLGANRKSITYVQSRWYRAPEVLLWSSISPSADAWSVGCVIAEVALGVPLLPGESEFNQLARIHAMLGAPPRSLLSRSRRADTFYYARGGGEPQLREERAREEPPLIRYVPHDAIDLLVDHVLPNMEDCERTGLLCVLAGLLQWDPHQRWPNSRLLDTFRDELKELDCEWPLDTLSAGTGVLDTV